MTKEHWQQTNKDHLRTLTDSELAAADEPESMVESYDGWRNPAAFIAADTFTLFGALGDVTGRAVLDLACGPGFTSRMLAQAGASPVVGVDFSEEIIALARAQEAAQPLGIEYRVEDVAAMPVLGSFNLATVVYLFNLTPSRASLAAMFRNIHENLAGPARSFLPESLFLNLILARRVCAGHEGTPGRAVGVESPLYQEFRCYLAVLRLLMSPRGRCVAVWRRFTGVRVRRGRAGIPLTPRMRSGR